MRNFLALFIARNREFYRDKGSLSWSLLFPLILIFGLNFALSNDKYIYKMGVIGNQDLPRAAAQIPYVEKIHYADRELALKRLRQHELDLVVSGGTGEYWINPAAKKSFFLEQSLRQTGVPLIRHTVTGMDVSYVAWLVPGILSMSLMFSCLYGVGYVITRYRNMGVLKRYHATPISALEFLGAQMASRLLITVSTLSVVFSGAYGLLHFPLNGSPWLLLLVAICGALAMISLSLVLAARIDSLELMNGLLNLLSWPMMFLSGLWFSLDGAPQILQDISRAMPLTHVVEPARAIMLEGAGWNEVFPHLAILLAITLVLMTAATRLFRWESA